MPLQDCAIQQLRIGRPSEGGNGLHARLGVGEHPQADGVLPVLAELLVDLILLEEILGAPPVRASHGHLQMPRALVRARVPKLGVGRLKRALGPPQAGLPHLVHRPRAHLARVRVALLVDGEPLVVTRHRSQRVVALHLRGRVAAVLGFAVARKHHLVHSKPFVAPQDECLAAVAFSASSDDVLLHHHVAFKLERRLEVSIVRLLVRARICNLHIARRWERSRRGLAPHLGSTHVRSVHRLRPLAERDFLGFRHVTKCENALQPRGVGDVVAINAHLLVVVKHHIIH
mmetsp:Transcript_40785/g.77886  ORF Transcript_40785/g.77886 Transcript_40785/m.77886 type:complete len:287 (-) Transcript_40785:4389-5249(-)